MNYEIAFWNSDFALCDADQQWFAETSDEIEAHTWASQFIEAEQAEASQWQRQADRAECEAVYRDNWLSAIEEF